MIASYTVKTAAPTRLLRTGVQGQDVRRVQEWLGLHGAGVGIDGDFGPATARGVSSFQQGNALPVTGEVDAASWARLIGPLTSASAPAAPGSFGQTVVAQAQQHLGQKSREIGGDNCGPWVRHYCRGFSVAWCQGFASTIWNDVAVAMGINPPLDLILDNIWCLFVPRMVGEARRKGRFVAGSSNPGHVPVGSMFFLKGGEHGYSHVGLVAATHDDGTMATIEGNTNDDGSPNGYEVAARTRRMSSCDFGMA